MTMNVPAFARAMLEYGREFDEKVSGAVSECNERIQKARAVFEEQRSAAMGSFMVDENEAVMPDTVRRYPEDAGLIPRERR